MKLQLKAEIFKLSPGARRQDSGLCGSRKIDSEAAIKYRWKPYYLRN
jgi:hypothetical protein